MAELGLEPIGLIPLCVLIQHINCKNDVTVDIALVDYFSLKDLELVATFGSSLFSKMAEQFLASLSSSWDRESHCMGQDQQSQPPAKGTPCSQSSCRRHFPKQVLPSSLVQRLTNRQAALQTERKMEKAVCITRT